MNGKPVVSSDDPLGASCGNKTIDFDLLVERDGLWYIGDSDTPFTGKTMGYWLNGQKKMEGGYRNGKIHGRMIAWDDNGQKITDGY